MVTKLTIPKSVKNEHEEGTRADVETAAAEEDEKVSLVTHVINILHSIFSNVDVYISNWKNYNSNELYAQKSYISNKFKGAISESKWVLPCEGYDYEKFHNENI